VLLLGKTFMAQSGLSGADMPLINYLCSQSLFKVFSCNVGFFLFPVEPVH